MGLKKDLPGVKMNAKIPGVTRNVLNKRRIENKYEKEE